MTPNNPCSPASSVFCKHLEETREKKKKGENHIADFYSGIWVKQTQGNDEEGNAFLWDPPTAPSQTPKARAAGILLASPSPFMCHTL